MDIIRTLEEVTWGDSIERKMDNQLHNRESRNGLLEKKTISVYTEGNNRLQFWAAVYLFTVILKVFLLSFLGRTCS